MKAGLYKAIEKKYAALFRQMTQRFQDERKRIGLGLADLERKIDALEGHTHRVSGFVEAGETVLEAGPPQ